MLFLFIITYFFKKINYMRGLGSRNKIAYRSRFWLGVGIQCHIECGFGVGRNCLNILTFGNILNFLKIQNLAGKMCKLLVKTGNRLVALLLGATRFWDKQIIKYYCKLDWKKCEIYGKIWKTPRGASLRGAKKRGFLTLFYSRFLILSDCSPREYISCNLPFFRTLFFHKASLIFI